MRTVIEINQISKKYKNHDALKSISLRVKAGEIFALVGLNGAGKSTLIKILMGLVTPTSGSIRYNRKDFKIHKTAILKGIGSLIETPGFYHQLTVYENLQLILNVVGSHKENAIEEVLDTVGIDYLSDVKIKRLTRTELQKVAIAKALLNNPSILILDEPLNGLDPESLNRIRTILLRLSKEKGVTIFLSSHILSEVERIADRVAIVNDGSLLEVIEPKNVAHHKKRIVMVLEDPYKFVPIINEKGISYKLDQNKIVLFTESLILDELINLCLMNTVVLKEIYYEEITLEQYFIDLIKLRKEL